MGVTVHKNSLENWHLLTKSGFSSKKVDYFDGNLLNKKMVVTKKLTKSRLLTILQVTKSGFHCTTISIFSFALNLDGASEHGTHYYH